MYQYKDIPIDDCAFGLLVQSFSVSNELFTRQCAQWLILTTPCLLQAVKLGLAGLFLTETSIIATTV